PPPPTPEELHRQELQSCWSRVALFDQTARDHTAGAAKDTLGEPHAHQRAAWCWQQAAEWCMRAAELDLARREHYVVCAQARLKYARRALVRWVWALGEPAPRARLKKLDGGGEVTPPKLTGLRLVEVDPEPPDQPR